MTQPTPMTRLDGLTNPHFAATQPAPKETTDHGPRSTDSHIVTYRKRRRSPSEEYAARVAEHGPLQRAPQGLVGLLLQTRKQVKVTRNGITLKMGRAQDSVRYWSPDSITCQTANIGTKVWIGIDPDHPEVCYVYTDAGGLAEVLPAEGKVPWFDTDLSAVAKGAQEAILNRDRARLQQLHQETDRQRAGRDLRNEEKLQVVRTFAPEAARDEAPAPMPEADRIAQAREAVTGHRDEYNRMERMLTDRRDTTAGRVEDFLPERAAESRIDREPMHRSDARSFSEDEEDALDPQAAALDDLT